MKEIDPQELKMGDWIVIMAWRAGDGDSLVGVPKQLVAVDYPFCVVYLDQQNWYSSDATVRPFSLDLRKVTVAIPSKEYLVGFGCIGSRDEVNTEGAVN